MGVWCVLGRVVNVQPLGQTPGFVRGKGFVQARRRMGVELIPHQRDAFGLAIAPLQQSAEKMRPIGTAAVLPHRNMAPAGEQLAGQKQAGYAVADGDMIMALDRSRPGRQRLAGFPDQLLEGFLQADHRPRRIMGAAVDRQHVLHEVDKLGRGLGRDTPHLPQVRAPRVFLSLWRTVSEDRRSA